jgi:hypothetical protein
MKLSSNFFVFFASSLRVDLASAFSTVPSSNIQSVATSKASCSQRNRDATRCQASTRRDVLSTIGLSSSMAFLPTLPVMAEEEDLASKLYNPDGSTKDDVEVQAKFRDVNFSWDVTDQRALCIDGTNQGDTKSGSQIHISYRFPFKWSDGKDGDELYFDRSEGTNGKPCKRIIVYQAAGIADMKRLEKAATTGVAKALGVPDELKRLYNADVVSGRVATRNGQTYYEYDMAAAPETCGDSKENLGLGFCPYDDVFLLSATILNDRLYVFSTECDSTKLWKKASADLKAARSSFTVEQL